MSTGPIQSAEDLEYTKKARHGHGKDVVDEHNIRQVAGCLPIDPLNQRFLLVSSRKNPGAWVIVSMNALFKDMYTLITILYSPKEDGKRMKPRSMPHYARLGRKQVSKERSLVILVYSPNATKRVSKPIIGYMNWRSVRWSKSFLRKRNVNDVGYVGSCHSPA